MEGKFIVRQREERVNGVTVTDRVHVYQKVFGAVTMTGTINKEKEMFFINTEDLPELIKALQEYGRN